MNKMDTKNYPLSANRYICKIYLQSLRHHICSVVSYSFAILPCCSDSLEEIQRKKMLTLCTSDFILFIYLFIFILHIHILP